MELLKGVNLTHAYDYTLFENVSLSVGEGKSIAILGVSGCGKSTLLHILCTLLKPNSGEVIYNGRSIYELSSDERLKIRRNDFGIIFQSHYLFKGFSSGENIELAAKLTNNAIDQKILKKLKIENTLAQVVGELSGGQQQRVSIFDYVKSSRGALVLVTHDENLAQKCCKVYRLNNRNLAQI